MLHCAAFNTNSSDQTNLRRPTWSVTCNSGNPGMFRVHSTEENISLAAISQICSIPVMLFCMFSWPYRVVYGSALKSIEM